MIYIERELEKEIKKYLDSKEMLAVVGARQCGKTTLIKQIQQKYADSSLYLNCDEPDIRVNLTNTTSTALKIFFGDKKLIFIDEAQRVENIGLTLKLIVDSIPEIQVVATGSSSFELSNKSLKIV